MCPDEKDLTGISELSLTSEPEQPSASTSTPEPVVEQSQHDLPSMELGELGNFDELKLPDPVSTEPAPAPPISEAPMELQAPAITADPLPPMESVERYSEATPAIQAHVPASLPFSVRIRGALTSRDRERLLEFLSREDFGIREVDLEPQFESGHVLIPRISEYAAIALIQALRDVQAQMEMGPAEEIFSSSDAEPALAPVHAPGSVHFHTESELQLSGNYESIVLTTDSLIAGVPLTAVDVVSATALAPSHWVEAKSTAGGGDPMDGLLETLKRELKSKAFRRGAHAVLNVAVDLRSLKDPGFYRVILTGSAARRASSQSTASDLGTSNLPNEAQAPTKALDPSWAFPDSPLDANKDDPESTSHS